MVPPKDRTMSKSKFFGFPPDLEIFNLFIVNPNVWVGSKLNGVDTALLSGSLTDA